MFYFPAPGPGQIDAEAVAIAARSAAGLSGQPVTPQLVADRAMHALGPVHATALREHFKGVAAFHAMMAGPRPPEGAPDKAHTDWRDGFDKALEGSLSPEAMRLIGASWIGQHLTDSEFDDEAYLTRACGDAGRAVAQNLMNEAGGAEPFIQALGIGAPATVSVVSAPADATAPAVVQGSTVPAQAPIVTPPLMDPATARQAVEAIVAWNVATYVDQSRDSLTLDMGAAAHGDEAAFNRITGAHDGFAPWRDAFLSYAVISPSWIADTFALVDKVRTDHQNGVATPWPSLPALKVDKLVADAGKPGKAKGGRKPKTPPAAPPEQPAAPAKSGVAVPTSVWQTIHANSGTGDDALGKLVGVSRSQVHNYVKGKASAELAPEVASRLSSHLREQADALRAAADILSPPV